MISHAYPWTEIAFGMWLGITLGWVTISALGSMISAVKGQIAY